MLPKPTLLPLLLLLSLRPSQANVRCYSCSPCNELELFAGDPHHFEADCYFDRYCMKITGQSVDIYGYSKEVSFRGCPWISLFTNLEEGCSATALTVAGIGLVQGTVCFCRDHLCNGAVVTNANVVPVGLAVAIVVYLAHHLLNARLL